MQEQLKILIFDGSFKTTPFINRLVAGLAVKHQVYILGFNEKLPHKLENVTYVALGSNENKLRFLWTCLRLASINQVIDTLKLIWQGDRKRLQQQNLSLAIKKIHPDIIHLQWPSVLPWFEEVLLEQKAPVVLSQRGFHGNVRPFVDKENFEYLRKWFPKLAGFHSVSKAIAVNGDKIWISENKIDKVIYTGLDIEKLMFLESYTKSEPLKLLSIGRAHWIKGYDYALQTCKLLKEAGLSFRYTIIGGAGDEELQFLIHDLGLADCVSLKNRMPQTEVFELMQNASVLLMPSIEEGIPNVVVEAMAVGLPVISTDCGGVTELIENEKEGWVVPVRDPKAMAEAVVNFQKLPIDTINLIRTAARKKVEVQHSEEKMVKGMEELYFEVLHPPTPL